VSRLVLRDGWKTQQKSKYQNPVFLFVEKQSVEISPGSDSSDGPIAGSGDNGSRS